MACVVVLAAGCIDFAKEYELHGKELPSKSDGAGPADGGEDAGAVDAGTSDAGASDAGDTDAGTSDAGTPDAGPPDAGPIDAGFCTALGCSKVFVFQEAATLFGAVLNQPEGIVLLGHQGFNDLSWYGTIDAGVGESWGTLGAPSNVGTIYGAAEGTAGDFFTAGTNVARFGQGSGVKSATCGSTSMSSWLGVASGLSGDGWFARAGEVCHWRADAGFEQVAVPAQTWAGVVPLDDGGLWLLDYDSEFLFAQTGEQLDAGAGTYFNHVQRFGARIYAWHDSEAGWGGLSVYDDATGWTQLLSAGVVGVSVEPGGTPWVLLAARVSNGPVLMHQRSDGGWTRFSNAVAPLPVQYNLQFLAGGGGRLVFGGRQIGSIDFGLAVEVKPN